MENPRKTYNLVLRLVVHGGGKGRDEWVCGRLGRVLRHKISVEVAHVCGMMETLLLTFKMGKHSFIFPSSSEDNRLCLTLVSPEIARIKIVHEA